jgi:hypothetical protein
VTTPPVSVEEKVGLRGLQPRSPEERTDQPP